MASRPSKRAWWGFSMGTRSIDVCRTLSRLALLGVIGGAVTACGSETTRFAGNPFSNPFGSSARVGEEPPMTGSLPDTPAAAPATRVESRPLSSPVASQPLPAPSAAPVQVRPAAVASAPVSPKGQGGAAGWSTRGGTPVTVASGDSLNGIATRYGVPASAILSANGLSSSAQVAPGRQIIIPVYNATGVAAASPAPAPSRNASVPQSREAEPKLRFVQGPKPAPQNGDKIGTAKDRVRQAAAAARNSDSKVTTKVAAQKPEPQKLVQVAKAEPKPVPIKPVKEAKAELAPKPVKAEKFALAAPAPAKPEKVAALAAPAPAKPIEVTKAVAPVEAAKPGPVKEVESTASIAPAAPAQAAGLAYRWPAKGRVISGFGGSGGNEGINIAVPEGTPVKAAEDGTVAYAGSEVKGYGKLVLIRHDNGYVSAYAHNGEVNVKPGEKVKRGQAIAKSGQTGNVTSPQLHFEIRKGAAPIDPMPHLQGG